MSRIRLNPQSDPSAALAVVRRTFVDRGYHWEPQGELTAVATEAGEPATGDVLAGTLRVVAEADPRKHRIVLKQKALGAAYGVPLLVVRLNIRFSRMVRAARKDLDAAGL